jgi:protoporphyrinogen oxidase
MKDVVIIGAGISGLATAWSLVEKGYNVTILEKNDFAGGMCASFKHNDFVLDYGPHKLYSQLPGMMQKFKDLIGESDTLTVKKKNSLRLVGKYFNFPINPVQMLKSIGPSTVLAGTKAGFGYAKAVAKGVIARKEPETYEEYFMKGFGKAGYELIFKDYAWKVWGDPSKLSEEIGRKRTPVPSIFKLVAGVISGSKNKPDVSAEFFYYPKKGVGVICDSMRKKIEEKGGKIIFNSKLTKIDIQNNKIESIEFESNGEQQTLKADTLVSTIPLLELIDVIEPAVDVEVKGEVKKLEYKALIVMYIVLNKERALKDNWIFFPERKFIFNRVSEQKSFSEHTGPADKTVLMAEVTCGEDSQLWKMSDDDLFKAIIRDLEEAGIAEEKEVTEYFSKRMKKTYPVYLVKYKQSLDKVQDYLDTVQNLLSIGRYGLFNYNNMDHCIDMAEKTADHIANNKDIEDWKKSREYFNSYRIVD